MSQKILIWFLLIVILIPSVIAVDEQMLDSCNLTDLERSQALATLNSGKLTDKDAPLIETLSSSCDLDTFDEVELIAVAEELDLSEMSSVVLEELSETKEVRDFINQLASSSVCAFIENSTDVLSIELPSFIPLNHDSFNFYLGKEPVANIVFEEKSVDDFSCGVLENSDFDVYINDIVVLEDLLNSKDPINSYKEAKSNGNIRIEGNSFGKQIKVGILNVGVNIASWFV